MFGGQTQFGIGVIMALFDLDDCECKIRQRYQAIDG